MQALAQALQNLGDWAHPASDHVDFGRHRPLSNYQATRGSVQAAARMVRSILSSRSGASGGISSFQAFTISLAARVGIGNVFGVAAALILGGPGAVFWMWVIALVGSGYRFALKPPWHRFLRYAPTTELSAAARPPTCGWVWARAN